MKKERPDFDTFYRELFSTRWNHLKEAMCKEKQYVAYSDNLLKPYLLDRASVLVAKILSIDPSDTVLDMCAAPGGKSLVLISSLSASGTLIANDRSANRRRRLIRVFRDHVPEPFLQRIRVTGHDATRWGLYEKDVYDNVLLDVPCSSERHLLHSPKHMAQWSPARTKRLAQQSVAMLLAALQAVKPGGRILYCTCALSPFENDEVLRKVAVKRSKAVRLIDSPLEIGEKTEFGHLILPDVHSGMGPLFCSLIEKRSV